MRPVFSIHLKFYVARFIGNNGSGITGCINTGSNSTTSESAETVCATDEKLLNVRQFDRVSVWQSNSDVNSAGPIVIQTDLAIISCLGFEFCVLRKRCIANSC